MNALSRSWTALAVGFLLLGSGEVRAQWYARGTLGAQWSQDADLRDHDSTRTNPPALFGVGPGVDGRPLGAYGDFGSSLLVEAGAGYRLSSNLRLELAAGRAGGFSYSGGSNFLRVAGAQPVTAELCVESLRLDLYVDLPCDARIGHHRVRPFLGAGAGVCRDRLDPVTYSFPGIAPGAVTITPGGTNTDLTWMATAGVACELSRRTTLDLAYRFTDLGEVRTDVGPATVVRPARTRTITIDETLTDLRTQGVVVGVRCSF